MENLEHFRNDERLKSVDAFVVAINKESVTFEVKNPNLLQGAQIKTIFKNLPECMQAIKKGEIIESTRNNLAAILGVLNISELKVSLLNQIKIANFKQIYDDTVSFIKDLLNILNNCEELAPKKDDLI